MYYCAETNFGGETRVLLLSSFGHHWQYVTWWHLWAVS